MVVAVNALGRLYGSARTASGHLKLASDAYAKRSPCVMREVC